MSAIDLTFADSDDAFDDDDDFDFQDSDDESLESYVEPPKATQSNKTKAKASKKTATGGGKAVKAKSSKSKNKDARVLVDRSTSEDNIADIDMDMEEPKVAKKSLKKKTKKTIEETYQKKTQLEHILLRPDTYIGSVEQHKDNMYVLEGEHIVEKQITYTPGLYKIFDEILVNAADNKQRDKNMDKLDITISAEDNTISVKNNGRGIPVAMHSEHKCYVPTLIFGHLLTGSNFDDNEKKTTGGRNGYGAKLANIFSNQFIVECVDHENGLKFEQVFRDNMGIAEEPKIKKATAAEKKRGDYVKITFSPDLERFKMDKLDNDTVALLSKRVYDIAGTMANREGKKLAVTLNGEKLPIKNFQTYLTLYKGFEGPAAYAKLDENWEVGIGSSDGSFKHISFVNAICTTKGGTHVNAIADQVAKKISATVTKKNKGGIKITESQMKNHMCVYVNCLIENPSFDSQTKENMTTRKSAFGSTCSLTDKFMKQVEKSDMIEKILQFAKFKQNQALSKKGGVKRVKLTGIVKLDDANFAGTAKSKDCTLILTEGDSAKSLAMSGLSVVGRDYYGCFPLRGKLLNVREAAHKQIVNNEEVKNIVDIMGLKYNTVYDENNIKTLRYGHIMIMADQDHDGSHIKGLVINFIHHFWPSLLDIEGFLQQFITPIVKATKGKSTKTFFTVPEYEQWKESTGNDGKGWKIKYYKGLGTSTSAEAKDYFSNLDLHEIHFENISKPIEDDGTTSDSSGPVEQTGHALIEMAFGKKHVNDRKEWLNSLQKGTFLNYSKAQEKGVTYPDFINKELILFSQADNQRSIPHLYDGFKPSQRKVLFACFLKNLKNEMKVAQLGGYVGEKSAYHHGETSLTGAIVAMAQDYLGSNNVNLLTPAGQFGTRRMGGKDAASARYIFTKLEKITRAIFHADDDPLLNYLNDDGLSIEPEYYMPVIPMLLVNGSDGIGTGYSTSVPTYNPSDIIANVRRKIKGEEMVPMHPHFYGFQGTVDADPKKKGCYVVSGNIERKDETTLHISELPVKKWTQDYKVFLEGMLNSDTKKEPDLKDFKENHTDTTVSFSIIASKEKIDEFEASKGGLKAKFKLTTNVNTTNMTVFDEAGRLVKYTSPLDIMDAFYDRRLHFYHKRKEHLLKELKRERDILSNKARFVEEVCSDELIVSNRKRQDILLDLQDRGYDLFPKRDGNGNDSGTDSESDFDENDSEKEAELAKGYEYLLGMKIWSLTFEKANKLRKELDEKDEAVVELEAKQPTDIWLDDLDNIEVELANRHEALEAAKAGEQNAVKKNAKRRVAKGKAKKTKGKKKSGSSSDDEDDEDFVIKGTKRKKVHSTKPKLVQVKATARKKETIDVDSSDSTKDAILQDAPKRKRAVTSSKTTKSAAKKIDSFDSDSDGSDFLMDKPPANKREAIDVDSSDSTKDAILQDAPKRKRAVTSSKTIKPPTKKIESFDLESDSDDSFSLMDKMRMRLDGSTKTNKPTTKKPKTLKGSSPNSSSSDKSLDSFKTETYQPAALTPAPAKKRKTYAARKQKPDIFNLSSGEEDSVETIEKETSKPSKKRVTQQKNTKAATAKDNFEFDSDSEDSVSVVVPRARSTRTRNKPTVTSYNEDSDFELSD